MAASYQMDNSGKRAGSQGFTIIEILIALVILALGTAFLTSTIADSLARQSRTRAQAQATDIAETLLAALTAEHPLVNGTRTGLVGSIAWSLNIGRYGPPTTSPIAAKRVTLVLSWLSEGRPRSAVWVTLRAAPAPR
jgi:prepilin-type N-terminal cleavage/methylation domain-containing protein